MHEFLVVSIGNHPVRLFQASSNLETPRDRRVFWYDPGRMALPGAQTLVALALLAIAYAARIAVSNRHIRSRLSASAVAFGACVLGGALVSYSDFSWLSPALRDQMVGTSGSPGLIRGIVQPLLLTFGFLNLLVALLVNPWRVDRLPDRFPKIVQDALVIGIFALAATVMFPDRIFAASAVGAVVIGFALQDTLGNLFAGLAIQIEKPFSVGQWVRIAGTDGLVSEITWRATKIRTKSGNFVVVPNSVLSRDTILNYSEPIRETRIEVEVGVSYASPPNEVKAVILHAIEREPLICASPAPEVLLVDFAASSITYRVRVWTTDFASDERLRDRIRSAIYYAFRRHQIEIPYPMQVEISRSDSGPAAPDAAALEPVLANVEILAALSPEARHALALGAHEHLYADGEAIVRQGDEGSSMFVVAAGETTVVTEPDGREVARHRPGGFFGEMSLLTGAKRSATVKAVGDTTVIEIAAGPFREFVLKNPALLEQIGMAVTSRAAELERHRAAGVAGSSAEAPQSFLARVQRFLRLNLTT